MIQDQVCNQVALRHPWVADPPLPTWFHGTPARHDPNPFLHEFASSPHAPAVDRARVLNGWFSDDSPDLNQDEPEVARYLIQNALWWVGMTGIDGIREDTAQYLPRPFLRDLTGALHRQHPRITIVGEALDTEPIHVSFFLGGKAGWDGVDTGLDSVFDFPTWVVAASALTGKAPMTDIRRVLRADSLYADPSRLTTLTNNHDNARVISWPGSSPALARLHLAFTLALRGIPQLYYGDEIAMPGEGDPDNRRDFPGGFPGDPRNAFEPSGRTPEEQQAYTWTRAWIALRRAHSALRRGESARSLRRRRHLCLRAPRRDRDGRDRPQPEREAGHGHFLSPGDRCEGRSRTRSPRRWRRGDRGGRRSDHAEVAAPQGRWLIN